MQHIYEYFWHHGVEMPRIGRPGSDILGCPGLMYIAKDDEFRIFSGDVPDFITLECSLCGERQGYPTKMEPDFEKIFLELTDYGKSLGVVARAQICGAGVGQGLDSIGVVGI